MPQALVVADVDLDRGDVRVLDPLTPYACAPEGVHALVWSSGVPLGEVTVVGQVQDVLAGLVQEAGRRLAAPPPDPSVGARTTAPGPALEPQRGDERVSVAVCTRDRPDALRTCLQALTALHDPVLELLVVDNASRDGRTREVTEQVAAEFPWVRYVHEPRRGLDWARNRALLEARGDVVAYTDDDVEVHPDWVGGLLRGFRDEPDATAVTGLVVPRELSSRAQVLFEAVGGFGRGYRRRHFRVAVQDGAVAAPSFGTSGVAGTGANMAFRRDRLLALGGFDTALDVGTPTGGGGDLEMFFRVVAAGDLLVYEPTAVVRHVHRPDMAGLLRQMRGHGTGSYAFWLGAGQRYPAPEARRFRRLAVRHAVKHHLAGYVRALRGRRPTPLGLLRAETRGAWDSVSRSYYRRAQQQAAAEQAQHGGPVVGPPVRGPAGAGPRGGPATP